MPILKTLNENGQWVEILGSGGGGGVSGGDADTLDGKHASDFVSKEEAGQKVYAQNEAPTDSVSGDLWIDMDDNTYVDITPDDIGAVPVSRTVNGKALNDDITLTATDVGAAPAYTYGTEDLVAGESELATGALYIVYE